MAAIHMKLAFAVMLLLAMANVQCFNFNLDINPDPNSRRAVVDVGIPGIFNVRAGGAGNEQGGGGGADVRVGDRFGVYATGHGRRNGGGGSNVRVGNPNPASNWLDFEEFLGQWGRQQQPQQPQPQQPQPRQQNYW